MANEFVTFTPYDEQLERLRRRQRMADMLQQQAMEPLESQVAPGGYVVPTSPLLGLAKMLQAYHAGKTQRGIDTELADIRSRMGEEQRTREAEIESAGKAIQGRMFDRPALTPVAQMPDTGDQLQEITPTAQYQYDPQGAFQAAMTPAGSAAMQKSPMLASMLANMMKPGDAEEFYAPTEVDGEMVQFGKRGGVKRTGYAPPKKEPDQMTPYQQQMIGLRKEELKARTTPGVRPLSATAQRELIDTDEVIASTASGISMLDEAAKLSPKAFEGVGAYQRAYAASQLPDAIEPAGAKETLEFDNLLKQQILPQLRGIFGANPTEGERQILLEMQGSASLPKAVREKMLARAKKAAEIRLKFNQDKAQRLRAGEYFSEPALPAGFVVEE